MSKGEIKMIEERNALRGKKIFIIHYKDGKTETLHPARCLVNHLKGKIIKKHLMK
jgi:hypothetical protein